jgi:POT family proton-dependent oligopeptide transporter
LWRRTRLFGKLKPIRSIVIGTVIISVAMLVNIVPVLLAGGVRASFMDWLPLGAVFAVLTVSMIAFGELFTSARTFEYIGALAPKGQEGLFLGYANLPMAIGSLIGGPAGAAIFNEIMCHGATKRPDGLLELDPTWNAAGWIVLMAIGLLSALSMGLYNRWLQRLQAAEAKPA